MLSIDEILGKDIIVKIGGLDPDMPQSPRNYIFTDGGCVTLYKPGGCNLSGNGWALETGWSSNPSSEQAKKFILLTKQQNPVNIGGVR